MVSHTIQELPARKSVTKTQRHVLPKLANGWKLGVKDWWEDSRWTCEARLFEDGSKWINGELINTNAVKAMQQYLEPAEATEVEQGGIHRIRFYGATELGRQVGKMFDTNN